MVWCRQFVSATDRLCEQVRELMISMRAVDALVILLEHSSKELVFTACGVRLLCSWSPAATHAR